MLEWFICNETKYYLKIMLKWFFGLAPQWCDKKKKQKLVTPFDLRSVEEIKFSEKNWAEIPQKLESSLNDIKLNVSIQFILYNIQKSRNKKCVTNVVES